MQIKKDYNLSKLNTFGINVNARFFVEVNSEKELAELFELPEFKQNKKLFLGGGSNVLFIEDFNGIVISNKLKGISIIEENTDYVLVHSAGGEKWHDLVMFAVNRGYWGIENMSLIPGTAGAAPIQNIGAYGAEIKDILFNVEAYEVETGEKKVFSNEECEFSYRESIFKNKLKGKYFISAVTLKLNKKENKNTRYKTLADFFEQHNIQVNGPKDISDAVITIRKSKLPDPKDLGSAGSFFKNVYTDKEHFQKLEEKYTEMPHFWEDEKIKIPSGWLIEQCGWKGKRTGNVGVYEKQALVLVNYGGATGKDIFDLANKIIDSVEQKFGLKLTPEVNIV